MTNNTPYTNDPYFQIKEYIHPTKGIDREVTILHISDLHLIVSDENSSDEWKAFAQKQRDAWKGVRLSFAKLYGDSTDEPHLIQPEEGLPRFIDLANEKRPDLLLLSGDMLNDFSTETIDYLGDALSKLQVPYMWVRGNHELGNDDAYAPYMQENAPVQKVTCGNLQILGLDDAKRKVTSTQLDALKAAVSDAAEKGDIPVLAMHIPVRTPLNADAVSHFDPYFLLGGEGTDDDSRAFLEYLQSESCPISTVLCGHVHGHHVSEFAEGKKMICCSSSMVGCAIVHRFTQAENE